MERKPITTSTIRQMKVEGRPSTMITAYDYAMARNVDEAGIDMILVGDSVGNVSNAWLQFNYSGNDGCDDSSYAGCRPWH